MTFKSDRLRLGALIAILAALAITACFLRLRTVQYERFLQTASLNSLIDLSKRRPGDARIFHYLALRARASRARKLAMDSYWQAVQLAPDSENDWFGWAAAATEAKGPIAGQAILLTFLKDHPNSYRGNMEMARLYRSWDYASLVLQYATKATQLDPHSVEAWVLVGQALLKLQREAEAEQAFGHATQIDSRSWQALTGLGKAQRLQKRFAAAISSLEKAVSQTATEVEPRVELGKAILEQAKTPADFAHAQQILQEAVRLNTAKRELLFESRLALGQCYLAETNYREAENWLEQAAAIEPGNATVLFTLARAYTQLKDKARAKLAMQRHTEVVQYQNHAKDLLARIASDPKNGDLRLELARLYSVHGDYVDAGRIYQYLMSNNIHAAIAERELLALQKTYLPRP